MSEDMLYGYAFGVYAERMGLVSRWIDNVVDPEGEEELKTLLKTLGTIEEFALGAFFSSIK